ELRHVEIGIGDDRIVRCETLSFLDVVQPVGVAVDRIDREPDDLDATLVELGLDPGHVAKLGRADRREILRVGKQDRPGIADPVVEPDLAFGRLSVEIGGRIIDRQSHYTPPSRARSWDFAAIYRALR